jgi:hypothetical protein
MMIFSKKSGADPPREVIPMAAEVERFQNVLEAALQLPVEQQQKLAEQLLRRVESKPTAQSPPASLAEQMWGTIKNVDRETLIRFAEDEEYSGY